MKLFFFLFDCVLFCLILFNCVYASSKIEECSRTPFIIQIVLVVITIIVIIIVITIIVIIVVITIIVIIIIVIIVVVVIFSTNDVIVTMKVES